jgi:hypothetical protein
MVLGEFCLIQERDHRAPNFQLTAEKGVLRIFQGDGELNSG